MKVDKLTPGQKALIPALRDEWIKFALNDGDEIDEKAAREGIDWLYHIAGLKKPVVIILDSPLAVQYGVPVARQLLGKATGQQVWQQVGQQVRQQVEQQVEQQVCQQVGQQVRQQVEQQVCQQVWQQVRQQVEQQVGQQVEQQVGQQVRQQVEQQVWQQVEQQVEQQVCQQVEQQVGQQVGQQVERYEPFATDTVAWYAGWASYIDFFDRLGVVKHSEWKKYRRFLKSGVFMGVYLDGLAVVCRRPSAVRRDDQARLHNDQKPAIEWRDGYKLYYLYGQAFDEKLWSKIVSQKMTIKDIMAIKNADERTMAISMLRPDRLLKHMNAKHLNTGQRGTKLYEVPNFMETGETEYCMVMQDSSTDRVFLEWTPPEIGKQGDADLCQANAWGVPLEDYLLLEAEA